jgi:hypothetical protein
MITATGQKREFLQLCALDLYTHALGPPNQHSCTCSLGTQPGCTLVDTIFLPPQRTVYHALSNPRGDHDKRLHDSANLLTVCLPTTILTNALTKTEPNI